MPIRVTEVVDLIKFWPGESGLDYLCRQKAAGHAIRELLIESNFWQHQRRAAHNSHSQSDNTFPDPDDVPFLPAPCSKVPD